MKSFVNVLEIPKELPPPNVYVLQDIKSIFLYICLYYLFSILETVLLL